VGCALAEALDPAEAGPPRIGLKWPNDLWLIDPTEPRGGRKLGGILIETAPIPDAARPGRTCVVGVGLNVRRCSPRTGDLPVDAGPGDAGFASGVAWLDELAARPAPRLPTPSDQALGTAACGGTLRISATLLDKVLDQELDQGLDQGLDHGIDPIPDHGAARGPTHGPAQVLARLAPPLLQALRRFEDEGLRPFLPSFDRRDLLRGRRVAADGPSPCHGVGDGVAPDGRLRLRQDDGCITFIHGGEVSLRALLEATPC
jgi:biotin-(acetyl-CoA carboxylase) ligase